MPRSMLALALAGLAISLAACSTPYSLIPTQGDNGVVSNSLVRSKVDFHDCAKEGCYGFTVFAVGNSDERCMIFWEEARYLRNGEDQGGVLVWDGRVRDWVDPTTDLVRAEETLKRWREAPKKFSYNSRLNPGTVWPEGQEYAYPKRRGFPQEYIKFVMPKALLKEMEGPEPPPAHRRIHVGPDDDPKFYDVKIFDLAAHELQYTCHALEHEEEITAGVRIVKND